MPEIIESVFKGLDLSQEPDNIGPGFVQTADNLVLDGVDLVTRPGLVAILTTPHSSGIFAYAPIVAAMSGEKGLYCADAGLYYWAGSTTAAVVSGAGTVDEDAAQIALMPGAGFLVDGTANLKRIIFDSGGAPTSAATITELDRPGALVSELTQLPARLLIARAQTWTQNYVTGDTRQSEYITPGNSGAGDVCTPLSAISFEEGNFWLGANNPYGFWADNGGDPTFGTTVSGTNGSNGVELDSDDYSVSGPDSVLSDPITLNARSVSGYARVAVVEYEAEAEDVNTTSEVVDLVVRPFATGPAQVTDPQTSEVIEERFRSPLLSPTQSTRVSNLVDFRALGTEPRTTTLEFLQPIGRDLNKGAIVNRVKFLVPQMKLETLIETDNRVTVRQGTVQVWHGLGSVADGAGTADKNSQPNTSQPGRLLTQGLYLETGVLSPTLDLSKTRTLALEVLPGAGVSGLQVRLLLKQTNWYATPSLDIPEGGGWSTVDLSVLQQVSSSTTIAGSALTAVSSVRIEILNDVLVEALQDQGSSTVFRFGDMKEAGNLLVGRDYWYALAEVNSNGDTTLINVIHSDGSVPTSAVQPTEGQRMVKLTLPARTNASSDYLALYRFGGAYLQADGDPALPTGRLLCWIAWATASFSAMGGDTQKPTSPASGHPVVFANPYILWTKTGSTGDAGSTLIDNTPDSWLSGADVYQYGREKAPTAPDTVAAWDSRLWLGDGSDLYASWEIEPGRNAGVYWTRTAETAATDPEAPKKGWWVSLALAPGDSIKRLLPVGGASSPYLLALTRYSAFVVSRSGNPESGNLYNVRELRGEDVGGTVGLYSCGVFEGSAWWLSDRGLLRWQPGQGDVSPAGDRVRRLLPGVSPSLTYNTTALAKCAVIASPHFLYLSVPDGAGDTTPDSTLVWHDREKGWTRWSKGVAGGSGDILAGFDGQLWRVGGSGDKSTPAGSATAVSISLRTRRIGEGLIVSNPGRLFYSIYLPGAVNGALTFTLLGDGTTNGTIAQTILGEANQRVRASRSGAGRRHDITLTASTIERLRVRGLGIDLIPSHARSV